MNINTNIHNYLIKISLEIKNYSIYKKNKILL